MMVKWQRLLVEEIKCALTLNGIWIFWSEDTHSPEFHPLASIAPGASSIPADLSQPTDSPAILPSGHMTIIELLETIMHASLEARIPLRIEVQFSQDDQVFENF